MSGIPELPPVRAVEYVNEKGERVRVTYSVDGFAITEFWRVGAFTHSPPFLRSSWDVLKRVPPMYPKKAPEILDQLDELRSVKQPTADGRG